MVWYENWHGKDWMGRKVPPLADHVEGMYNEQEKEPVVEKMKIVDIRDGTKYCVLCSIFKLKG